MTTPAQSKGLWAPIVKPDRGAEWIHWYCIRTTRKEAKRAYLDGVVLAAHKMWLRKVRFARVMVVEDVPSAGDRP